MLDLYAQDKIRRETLLAVTLLPKDSFEPAIFEA